MTTKRPTEGQELVDSAAPLPPRTATPPAAPPVDDANRFALYPVSVTRIQETATLLDTDPNTVANGGAQFYAFIADLIAKGWILAGIDPEDGQTRPIEWSGFDKIQNRKEATQ